MPATLYQLHPLCTSDAASDGSQHYAYKKQSPKSQLQQLECQLLRYHDSRPRNDESSTCTHDSYDSYRLGCISYKLVATATMTATTATSTVTPATLTGIAAGHTAATIIVTAAPAAVTAIIMKPR